VIFLPVKASKYLVCLMDMRQQPLNIKKEIIRIKVITKHNHNEIFQMVIKKVNHFDIVIKYF
jgi:hypothetical protein